MDKRKSSIRFSPEFTIGAILGMILGASFGYSVGFMIPHPVLSALLAGMVMAYEGGRIAEHIFQVSHGAVGKLLIGAFTGACVYNLAIELAPFLPPIPALLRLSLTIFCSFYGACVAAVFPSAVRKGKRWASRLCIIGAIVYPGIFFSIILNIGANIPFNTGIVLAIAGLGVVFGAAVGAVLGLLVGATLALSDLLPPKADPPNVPSSKEQSL